MSIERSKGRMQLVCDDCSEPLTKDNGKKPTYADDEFDIMIEDAKDMGWDIHKNKKGQWEHTCFDCVS